MGHTVGHRLVAITEQPIFRTGDVKKKKEPPKVVFRIEELSILVPADPVHVKGVRELLLVNLRNVIVENQASWQGMAIPFVPETAPFTAAQFEQILGMCDSQKTYKVVCHKTAVSIVSSLGVS